MHTVPSSRSTLLLQRRSPLHRHSTPPSFSYLNFPLLLQAQVVPWKLWAAVAGLLAIDVILLLVWTLVDPLSREVSLVMS